MTLQAGVSEKSASKVSVKKEPGTVESVGSANSSKSRISLGNKTNETTLGVSDMSLVFKKELKFTCQIDSQGYEYNIIFKLSSVHERQRMLAEFPQAGAGGTWEILIRKTNRKDMNSFTTYFYVSNSDKDFHGSKTISLGFHRSFTSISSIS